MSIAIPQKLHRGFRSRVIDAIIDVLRSFRIIAGPGIRTRETPEGTIIESVTGPSTDVTAQAGLRRGMALLGYGYGVSIRGDVTMLDGAKERWPYATIRFPLMPPDSFGLTYSGLYVPVTLIDVPCTEAEMPDGTIIKFLKRDFTNQSLPEQFTGVVSGNISADVNVFPYVSWALWNNETRISEYPADDVYMQITGGSEMLMTRSGILLGASVYGYSSGSVVGTLRKSPTITWIVGGGTHDPTDIKGDDGIWYGDGWFFISGSTLQARGAYLNNSPPPTGTVRTQFNGYRGNTASEEYIGEGTKSGKIIFGNPSWKYDGKSFIRNHATSNSNSHIIGFTGGIRTVWADGVYQFLLTVDGVEYKSSAPEPKQGWVFDSVEGEEDSITLEWDGYKRWAVTSTVFMADGRGLL